MPRQSPERSGRDCRRDRQARAGTRARKVRVTAVDSRPGRVGPPAALPVAPPRQVLAAYVALTKPRIIELLLVTTVPDDVPGRRRRTPRSGWSRRRWSAARWPRAAPTPSTATSTATSTRSCTAPGTGRWPPALVTPAGGAGVRARARRGVGRPGWRAGQRLARGGAGRAARSPSTSSSTRCGLKRRTPQNIVWGGAAGCMPVLIGWSAVTGSLAWAPRGAVRRHLLLDAAALLAAVAALPRRLRRRRGADAPRGAPAPGRGRQIVAYRWAMVAARCCSWPVAHTTAVYAAAAVVLGAAFLLEATGCGPGCGPVRPTSARCGCSTGRSRT